jgi:hypothetical protein
LWGWWRNPDQKIEPKMFHAEILNDHSAIKAQEEKYVELPKIREVAQEDIEGDYKKFKMDIQEFW